MTANISSASGLATTGENSDPSQPQTLWIRKIGLTVTNQQGQGLDLSGFKITFSVENQDVTTPNTARIRIYNLAKDTVRTITKEYTSVWLNAGYTNSANYGLIFSGDLKQFKYGKENSVDSYLELFCADGDSAYTTTVINQTVAAGATQKQIGQRISGTFNDNGTPQAGDYQTVYGDANQFALPRGKVLFGQSVDYQNDWATHNGFRTSIQNGQLVIVPITGYRPGEAVYISSTTGMVGVPEETNQGITVKCLLNPLIRVGCLIQLNPADILGLTFIGGGQVQYGAIPQSAPLSTSGFYRVMISEFVGDTRGQEWYTTITALAVDISQPINKSVLPNG
jgi:hypothetical protein